MIQATENLHIGDLISRRVPFVVPKYQRPYAWEEEEIRDFIKDLNELYEYRLQGLNSPKEHFFGGIVSVNRYAPNTYTGRVYDVVDGQQRLATVICTLALLVRGLETLSKQALKKDPATAQASKSYADTIRESYLEYKEVVKNQTQTQLRLQLSHIDNSFFEALVKTGDTTHKGLRESQQKLQQAWKLISRHLIQPILQDKAIDFEEKLDRFLTLRKCITEDCSIIHIVSDDIGEAFRLFAILNDRGRSLSTADLLRVHTLELLEDHLIEQERVEKYWDDILGNKNTDVDHFLRAYYPSHKGDRAASRTSFTDRFRTEFFSYKIPLKPNQVIDLEARIAGMKEESRVFLDILDGQWPFDASNNFKWEKDSLSNLINVLKHVLCIPLLMSAHQCLPEMEFAKLICLLERFTFRYITMVGVHAGSLGDVYYRYAANIRKSPSSFKIADLVADLKTLQNENATDSLFEEAIKQKLIYSKSATQNIRYFLTTIEYYLRWYNGGAIGKPTPDTTRIFNLNQTSLEHVYPQTAFIPDILLEPFKNDIGNLTFWGPSDNSSAGNKSFSVKKQLYAQSMVRLNQDLASLAEWEVKTLESRKQRLIEIAKKVFTA